MRTNKLRPFLLSESNLQDLYWTPAQLITHHTSIELGYGVIEAANGTAALHILGGDQRISLLFTDLGLPGGLNGRQLADEARRLRPDLRILFTTAYATSAILRQGRLDPGVDLLAKPFTSPALAAKIRKALDA